MDDKKMLMHKLQKYDFALYDCALFLDTHPYDMGALEFYKKNKEKRNAISEEYTCKYGPLATGDYCEGSWEWSTSPWPWQKEGEL